jgi:uracil-DNA glycosylase family protein
MRGHPPATGFIPPRLSLPALARAAQACTACDLYKRATQAVMGEGRPSARLVLVGEQPGDKEDLAGRPFVGPAGALLDAALAEAGIARGDAFVTNAVKHFKWEARGKRRIHQKPSAGEVQACRPWLEAELELVRPEGIVCLGATAAQALLGASFRLTKHHGEFFPTRYGPWATATLHPSAVLRAPDEEKRRAARAQLVADLRRVAARLARSAA